jgi:hypothetical protein
MIGNQPPKTYLPENVHLHLLKLNNHNNQNAEHLLNEMVELLGILTGNDDNSALLSLLGIKNLTDAFISFGNLIGKYIQPNVFDKEPYDALDWKILRFLAQAVQALKNQHLLNQEQDEERDRAKNQEKSSPELLFVEEFFSNSETKKEFSSIQLYLKELQKIELSRLDDHPYQTTICRLEIPLLVSFTQNYFLQFSYFQLALDYWQKLTPGLGTEDNLNDRLIIMFLFISLGFVSELFLPEIVFPLNGSNEKETKESENNNGDNKDNHENNNINNKRKRSHTTEELKSCFERMRDFSSFYCSGNIGNNNNNNNNSLGSGERGGGGDRGAGRNELCPIAPAPSLDPHHHSSFTNQLKLEEIPLVASPPFSPFSPPATDYHHNNNNNNNNQSTMTGAGAAALASFPSRLTEKTIHDLLYQENNPTLFLFYRESVCPLLSKQLPRITENLSQRLSSASSEASAGGKKGLTTDFHSSMSMLLPAHLPSMEVFHTSLLKSRSSFASSSYDCLMNRDEQLSPEESIRHCLQQLKKAEQLIWELLTRHLEHPLLTVNNNGCSGTGTPRSAAAQAALAANDPQRRGSSSNSTAFPMDFFRIVFLYDYYIDYYLLTIKAEGQRLASQLSSSSNNHNNNNNNNNSVPGGASSPSAHSPASFIASLIHQEEIHKYLNHTIHYPSEIYELAYHYNHYYSYNSNNMSSCCSFWENHSFYYQSRIIAIKRYFPLPGQNTNTVVTEGQESKTGSKTASRTGTPPQSRPLPHQSSHHAHSPHLIHHSSSPTHSSRSSSGSSSPVTLGGLPVTTLKEFTHQLEKHLSQQQEQHK